MHKLGYPVRPELEAALTVLREAEKYIAGVNADCPKGEDEDRDELLEKIKQALALAEGGGK